MKKILIVSVGGSCEPVVTCINEIKPDQVIFFCSGGAKSSKVMVTGDGSPCEVRKGGTVEKLPNILVQTAFEKKFNENTDLVIVEDPDRVDMCYLALDQKIADIKKEDPDCVLFADYTGGTKTMSAALTMAARDNNVSALFVTTSERRNLQKVESGQYPRRISIAKMHYIRRLKEILPKMFKQYNYPAAIEELKTVLQEVDLPSKDYKEIQSCLDYCMGLNCWDCFDHLEALKLLEPQMKKPEIKELVLFLKRVISSRQIIDKDFDTDNIKLINGHGFEVVEDLLLNARRCTYRGRYDDAVGRIYRALELTAQIRLKTKYSLITGDIDINNEHLSEETKKYLEQKRNDKGMIQTALRESFILLDSLGDEGGRLFVKNESRIIDCLTIRNNSLFAHGFKTINKDDYDRIEKSIAGFIVEIINIFTKNKTLKPAEFPVKMLYNI